MPVFASSVQPGRTYVKQASALCFLTPPDQTRLHAPGGGRHIELTARLQPYERALLRDLLEDGHRGRHVPDHPRLLRHVPCRPSKKPNISSVDAEVIPRLSSGGLC